MVLRFSFNPLKVLVTFFLVLLVCVHAQAFETQTTTNVTVWQWLNDNWAIVAVVISEGMSFLPTKAKGIVQGIFTVLQAIFKKK